MYTHYTAVFPLGAQLIWALVTQPRARWALLGANIAAAVGFSPWLPALIKNTHSFGTKVFGILEPFGLGAVGHDLAHVSIGHPYIALSTVPGTAALVLILLGVGVALLGLAGRAGHVPDVAPRVVLVALLAGALPVALALYSALGSSIWDMRNLICSWPGFALALGALLTSAKQPLHLVAAALVATGFAIGAVKLASPQHQRPDYTAAARFLIREGAPDDPIAVVPAPTPGPLSAVDAALRYAGEPGRPLLRVGSAPLEAVLKAPPYALLPATPPATLAGQAAAASARGKLFVIAPGMTPLSALLGLGRLDPRAALGPVFGSGTTGRLLGSVFGALSSFFKALAPQFQPLQRRTFPGFLRLSVYVLERR
jgi:hypothetical protein